MDDALSWQRTGSSWAKPLLRALQWGLSCSGVCPELPRGAECAPTALCFARSAPRGVNAVPYTMNSTLQRHCWRRTQRGHSGHIPRVGAAVGPQDSAVSCSTRGRPPEPSRGADAHSVSRPPPRVGKAPLLRAALLEKLFIKTLQAVRGDPQAFSELTAHSFLEKGVKNKQISERKEAVRAFWQLTGQRAAGWGGGALWHSPPPPLQHRRLTAAWGFHGNLGTVRQYPGIPSFIESKNSLGWKGP